MTETVAAFERHLLDHLDDVPAWSAYADYLTEQGEPRGDFMRVQLALEDETLPKAERRALHEEEGALRVKHLEEWVGTSYAAKNFTEKGRFRKGAAEVTFRRGWLWEVARAQWDRPTLRDRPDELLAWRWLHTLDIIYANAPLAGTQIVRNMRSLRIGDDETHSSGGMADLTAFLAAATRLETLHLACGDAETPALFCLPLVHLRELHVHCAMLYATDRLAENPAFAGLQTLAFHPHGLFEYVHDRLEPYLTATNVRDIAYSPHLKRLEHLQLNCCNAGDEGIDLLVNSGMIHRLKSLDLRHGCVTDAGALTLVKALAGTPHALASLKLGDNAVTGDGVAALRRLKLTLDAPDQHAPGDDAYLTQGDME